jgi:neurotransmitter:Na+ symporter, NSS family
MQGLFLLTVTFILSRDITSGLERANRIMMPMLFIMLLAVAGYGLIAGSPKEALIYLLTPDFSKLNNATIAAAVGQGFFSVGVGSAILITFGAYMNKDIKIGSAALTIGIADTAIALLAGFGIFAIVFSQGLDPAAGPGLIFITLPVAFSSIPGGYILGILFFILVLFAALTSALALAEVTISWAEYRLNLSRRFASWAVLLSNFMIGLLTVFSFNLLSEYRLAETGFWAEKNLFEVKDYITSSILMPVSGLLIVFFAYWGIKSYRLEQAFGQDRKIFMIWLWLGRIVSPLGIIWVFWTNL